MELLEGLKNDWLMKYEKLVKNIESSMHWIYNSFRKNKNIQINHISIHEDSCVNNTNLISKIKKMEHKYGPFDRIPNEQFEIYDILTKSLDRINNYFF